MACLPKITLVNNNNTSLNIFAMFNDRPFKFYTLRGRSAKVSYTQWPISGRDPVSHSHSILFVLSCCTRHTYIQTDGPLAVTSVAVDVII